MVINTRFSVGDHVIYRDVGNADDTDTLTLGIIREGDSRLLKGAIYYFALYNKSLTPEEVEEEKVKLENYWEGGKNELA